MKKIISSIAIFPLFLAGCEEKAEEAASVEESLTEYKAIGTEPGWTVDIKDGQIIYSTMEGSNDFSLPIQRTKKTDTGWEVKGFSDQHNITLTILSDEQCNDGMSDRLYADTVKIAVSEGGYHDGCGGEILSDPEAS